MEAKFKKAVSSEFLGLRESKTFYDTELKGELLNRFKHNTPASLYRYLIDLKNAPHPGRIQHAIALYFLTIMDDNFEVIRRSLDECLFGEGRTFETKFSWSPKTGDKVGHPAIHHSEVGTAKPHHFARDVHETVMGIRRDLLAEFVGRKELLGEIDKFVNARMAGLNSGLLMITAPPGYGKSALAAKWCESQANNPTRHVVSHFFQSAYAATSNMQYGLEYMNAQLAGVYGDEISDARPVSQIMARLAEAPAYGEEIILWVDGLDEASDAVEQFVPSKLGDRISVIISCRADESDDAPEWFSQFIDHPVIKFYDRVSLKIPPMNCTEVGDFLSNVLNSIPEHKRKYYAEEVFLCSHGIPLIIWVIKEAIANDGTLLDEPRNIERSFGYGGVGLFGIGRSMAKSLSKSSDWHSFELILKILAYTKMPIDFDIIRSVLKNAGCAALMSIPPTLGRWLRIDDMISPKTISFSHPLLQTIFRTFYESEELKINRQISRVLINSIDDKSRYALLNAFYHLSLSRDHAGMKEILQKRNLLQDRVNIVGVEKAIEITLEDFLVFDRTRHDVDGESESNSDITILQDIVELADRFNYTAPSHSIVVEVGTTGWHVDYNWIMSIVRNVVMHKFNDNYPAS